MELGWMKEKKSLIDEQWHDLEEVQQQLQTVHGAGIAVNYADKLQTVLNG